MSMPKVSMRKFALMTEPSVADPAWETPVFDITHATATTMSNADEILRVVWKMQFDLGKASGRTEVEVRITKFLESKGWTDEQIREALCA